MAQKLDGGQKNFLRLIAKEGESVLYAEQWG